MSDWNFEEFLRRLEEIKGQGKGFFEELARRSPKLGELLKGVQFSLEEFEPYERILRSMTLEERLDPRLLDDDAPGASERRARIAQAAGVRPDEVDTLISQFEALRRLLDTKGPEQIAEELIEEQGGKPEVWQASPDAWKQGLEPVFVAHSDDEDDVSEDEDDEPGAVGVDDREERVDPETARLDEILRKISQVGLDGLDPLERAFLDEQSAKLRARA